MTDYPAGTTWFAYVGVAVMFLTFNLLFVKPVDAWSVTKCKRNGSASSGATPCIIDRSLPETAPGNSGYMTKTKEDPWQFRFAIVAVLAYTTASGILLATVLGGARSGSKEEVRADVERPRRATALTLFSYAIVAVLVLIHHGPRRRSRTHRYR